jgi:hypothetical protein
MTKSSILANVLVATIGDTSIPHHRPLKKGGLGDGNNDDFMSVAPALRIPPTP